MPNWMDTFSTNFMEVHLPLECFFIFMCSFFFFVLHFDVLFLLFYFLFVIFVHWGHWIVDCCSTMGVLVMTFDCHALLHVLYSHELERSLHRI